MFSPPLDNQNIPSKTTNFLCPCNEDAGDEELASLGKSTKKEFVRSYSCDVILAKKPHPFRSPMTFVKSSTLPRSNRKDDLIQDEVKLKQLTLGVLNSQLDEEYPYCNQVVTATTDNTPFCGLSNQPYYAQRHPVLLGKLTKRRDKGSRGSQNVNKELPFDGHYATMRSNRKEKKGEFEGCKASNLRRRASSFDFLPSAISKSCPPNGNSKGTLLGRTTSLSQRSPFSKKTFCAVDSFDLSLQGVKDLRPKANNKRLRSGLESLFDSIEKHDIEELQKILNSIDLNLNEVNSDRFTPLDVAIMSGELEIASILLKHGGKENPCLSDAKAREEHLKMLIEHADKKVSNYGTLALGDSKDSERQLSEWEWKLLMLRIMYNKFTMMDTPTNSPSVVVAPLSNHSVLVTIDPSEETDFKNIVTKYKVEWSRHHDFREIQGTLIIADKRHLNCTIPGLEKGIGWYIRVTSGNLKGFSQHKCNPSLVYTSSWHDCDLSIPRYYETNEKLNILVNDLLSFQREVTSMSDEESAEYFNHDAASQRCKHKKGGFSKYTSMIFNSAPKLLKKIKRRGIYLAALLYSDDLSHILVTMDDNLPIVECDENYSKTLTQEIHWFAKTSCTWKDIDHMLYLSTKFHSSQYVQIRRKLLQSAVNLMTATGVSDLGSVHYKPLKDNTGSLLLLAVNCIKKTLDCSRSTAMKWIPIAKLVKRSHTFNETVIFPERIISSVEELVNCHRRSRVKLPKGLYLGYLKLRTSMDVLSIIVPNIHTNVLPYVKIQDVPNLTKDEWHWLKHLGDKEMVKNYIPTNVKPFEKRLESAINQMFLQFNIYKEIAMTHRIYDGEVVELNSDVLFLLLCPSCDDICTLPNQPDGFTGLSDYSAIPLQAFEMANMMTYQPNIMSSYCRLSSILELENYCMQQIVRQTICHNELKPLKEKQTKLAEFQQSVDDLWRASRWVFDAIQACQDKNLNTGITIDRIYHACNWTFNGKLVSAFSSGSANYENDMGNNLVVHGCREVGLGDASFVKLDTYNVKSVNDLIYMASEKFHAKYMNYSYLEGNCDAAFLDRIGHLRLVVISDLGEMVLSNDNLKEKLWTRGKTYLQLDQDSQWLSGISTRV